MKNDSSRPAASSTEECVSFWLQVLGKLQRLLDTAPLTPRQRDVCVFGAISKLSDGPSTYAVHAVHWVFKSAAALISKITLNLVLSESKHPRRERGLVLRESEFTQLAYSLYCIYVATDHKLQLVSDWVISSRHLLPFLDLCWKNYELQQQWLH